MKKPIVKEIEPTVSTPAKPTRDELIQTMRDKTLAGRLTESEVGELLDYLHANGHLKGWA